MGLIIIRPGPVDPCIFLRHRCKSKSQDQTNELGEGRWRVEVRCNVQKIREYGLACPTHIYGYGRGSTAYVARYYGELAAKARLKSWPVKDCYTRHCHGTKCWKNGMRVPCPWFN